MTSRTLKELLNEEQYQAVIAPDGPILVIAAAGTGKTRTLTYRVAYLIEERGIPPERILLLTFTNRAAEEMIRRARELTHTDVGGMWAGTFHHAANRILRRHASAIGYTHDYTILDEEDSESLIRDCSKRQRETLAHFPKPEVLRAIFSYATNRGVSVEEEARRRFPDRTDIITGILQVHEAYVKRKKDLNAMDFDDLLVNVLRLFREQPGVLALYQRRFSHILVDEYQDTNRLQSDWVDLLAAAHRNLFVVGDDFQSIYAWRGADYRNILDFPKRYPDARIYMLETNYRSLPPILEVANACIAHNPEQFQKTLRAVRSGGGKPELWVVSSPTSQAAQVVALIRQLLDEGIAPEEIAILYRAHYHAMELQLELTREKLPFVITSGVRFFEQAHVKDVCSLVRLWVNSGDELAFARLFCLLPKVGPGWVSKVWAGMGKRCDLRDSVQRAKLRHLLPEAAQPDWAAIEKKLDALIGNKENAVRPDKLVEAFWQSFYRAYLSETFEDAERRTEDVEALIDFAAQYETAEAFVSEIALLTNVDAAARRIAGAQRTHALRLSTIHQAKGLEWKVVILLWMVEGMFPSGRALSEGGESEERRLFYVAVTRAKDRLYLFQPLSRCTQSGYALPCNPSRFLTELPRHLYKCVFVSEHERAFGY